MSMLVCCAGQRMQAAHERDLAKVQAAAATEKHDLTLGPLCPDCYGVFV